MNKLFVFVVTGFLSLTTFAGTLDCGLASVERESSSKGVGIYDVIKATCRDSDNESEKYSVKIIGYGLSLRLSGGEESFVLVCPLREGNEIVGTYVGAKLEASVVLGIRGGLFYSQDKACILTGGNVLSLGIALTGSKMTIEKY
jgi:hypothetical protein